MSWWSKRKKCLSCECPLDILCSSLLWIISILVSRICGPWGGGAGVGVREVSVKQQAMNVIVMHYNPLGFRSLVKSLTCIHVVRCKIAISRVRNIGSCYDFMLGACAMSKRALRALAFHVECRLFIYAHAHIKVGP